MLPKAGGGEGGAHRPPTGGNAGIGSKGRPRGNLPQVATAVSAAGRESLPAADRGLGKLGNANGTSGGCGEGTDTSTSPAAPAHHLRQEPSLSEGTKAFLWGAYAPLYTSYTLPMSKAMTLYLHGSARLGLKASMLPVQVFLILR